MDVICFCCRQCRLDHYKNVTISKEIQNSNNMVEIKKYCGHLRLDSKKFKSASISERDKIFNKVKKTFDSNFVLYIMYCQHKQNIHSGDLRLECNSVLYEFINDFEEYAQINPESNLCLLQSISYSHALYNIEYLKSNGFINLILKKKNIIPERFDMYNGELNDDLSLKCTKIELVDIANYITNGTIVNLHSPDGFWVFNDIYEYDIIEQIKKYIPDVYTLEHANLLVPAYTYIVKNKYMLTKSAKNEKLN